MTKSRSVIEPTRSVKGDGLRSTPSTGRCCARNALTRASPRCPALPVTRTVPSSSGSFIRGMFGGICRYPIRSEAFGDHTRPRAWMDEQVIQWREDTPGVAGRVHLNNAGASLMPKSVLSAITEHLQRESLLGGYEAEAEAAEAVRNVYAAVAGRLRSTPGQVGIRRNATVGFHLALCLFEFY